MTKPVLHEHFKRERSGAAKLAKPTAKSWPRRAASTSAARRPGRKARAGGRKRQRPSLRPRTSTRTTNSRLPPGAFSTQTPHRAHDRPRLRRRRNDLRGRPTARPQQRQRTFRNAATSSMPSRPAAELDQRQALGIIHLHPRSRRNAPRRSPPRAISWSCCRRSPSRRSAFSDRDSRRAPRALAEAVLSGIHSGRQRTPMDGGHLRPMKTSLTVTTMVVLAVCVSTAEARGPDLRRRDTVPRTHVLPAGIHVGTPQRRHSPSAWCSARTGRRTPRTFAQRRSTSSRD